MFASPQALPPYAYGGAFPQGLPFVDHDRRMLRTHLIAQKQNINDLQQELETLRQDDKKIDDLVHKGHHELHNLNAN
jgi:hypothetical protein